jgi:hypothetical protein
VWLRLLLALGILALFPVGTAVASPDRTPPKLKAAVMKDTDHDGKADVLVLTFSERVVHRRDADGRYPFTVSGYRLRFVGAAAAKTIALALVEKPAPDGTAAPAVTYRRTTSKPVRDRAGNQATRQTFRGTRPTGFVADTDGDGFLPPADCAPADAAIHPGAADLPEPTFTDANCDGIDGDKASAVFVSPTGANSGGCGAFLTPCQTLQVGLQEAVLQIKREVYLAAGTYTGPFVLMNGVDVYGGFSSTFARSSATTGVNQSVTLNGGLDGLTGQYLTVRASSIAVATTLADVRVVGPNATGSGATSYGIVVQSSGPLMLTRLIVQAGVGAAGAPGSAGTNATQTAAVTGGTGGNGNEYTTACDNSSRGGGGPAGTNGLVGPSATGGVGGAGGTMDTDCACCSFDFNARAGLAGGDATVVLATAGKGGGSGPANSPSDSNCDGGAATPGGAGQPGRIANGGGGSAGNGSQLMTGFWTAAGGTAGTVGLDGGGGGGGGGAGGCDAGTDAYGAGGGGGGAGGARATAAGTGGGGGGASFAVFVTSSTVTIANSTLTGGSGGTGGQGGAGGAGQPGGAGGPGGLLHPGAAPAGAGGSGAHGGHSGGGGGGEGGYSYVVYSYASAVTQTANTLQPGSAGAGGLGGPAAGADGAPGPAGAAGLAGTTGVCAAPSGC